MDNEALHGSIEAVIAANRPTDTEITSAQATLSELFSGSQAVTMDARYRRGLQDVINNRQTDDASFYAHCEALASLANYAYDKPCLGVATQ